MNMSYCQFQNTFLDLRQCYNALVDDGIDAVSPEELSAMKKMRKLCQEFIDEYDEQNGVEAIDEPVVNSDDSKPYQYNVGDKVRIIGNSNMHRHAIGDVVTITIVIDPELYQVDDKFLVRRYDMEPAE